MKKLITPILLSTALFACNNTTNHKPETSAAADTVAMVEEPKVNYEAISTDEALIATALMAAPKESRDGCTVIGYNLAGEFVTLKEGSNEFICLADDPSKDGFSAACYHKSLEPFMARGRELKAEGKNHNEIFDIREEEAKAGKLEMGKPGATLHIYYGAKARYNPENKEVDGAQYRYVVYMPWATSESTGLPESPVEPNHPWIMNPGTHRAHIMITPLKGEEK